MVRVIRLPLSIYDIFPNFAVLLFTETYQKDQPKQFLPRQMQNNSFPLPAGNKFRSLDFEEPDLPVSTHCQNPKFDPFSFSGFMTLLLRFLLVSFLISGVCLLSLNFTGLFLFLKF